MDIHVPLDKGYLPDLYGKYAPPTAKQDGHAIISFPITFSDVPQGTKSLALTVLDWDSIPVCGFCWIHWVACNIAPDVVLIPENASRSDEVAFVQGSNSECSRFLEGRSNANLFTGYIGPRPPDKDHTYTVTAYALDAKLDLDEGFFLNELFWAMEGHILATATQHVTSRS